MSSLVSTYDDQRDVSREHKRKKRRTLDSNTTTSGSGSGSGSGLSWSSHSQVSNIRWRSSLEQQTYSSQLLQALRHVNRRRTPTTTATSGSRAVREAADKALAIAAKGRTRWSRAILTTRLKLRLKAHKKAKVKSKFSPPPPPPPPPQPQPQATESTREQLPGLDKKVKVLGRLVPGCRKLSFPVLLEEATDYIAALQMQVRTMAALAELLSGSSTAAGSMDIDSNNVDDDPVR